MIHIFFIRHAESLGNVNHHLIGGQSNHLPLSERGIEQAHRLARRFKTEGLHFDQVWSSTALRARHTAEIVCNQLPIQEGSPIQLSDQILEMSQGEWEGLLRSEIYTPERIQQVVENPLTFKPPGGESKLEVEQRMYDWLLGVLHQAEEEQMPKLAVFSHGLAIKCLLRKLLKADPNSFFRTQIHNTSLTCLKYKAGEWWLDRLNDYGHLAGMDMIEYY